MKPVRVALVGCGKVGHIHAQALAVRPEAEFVAVCDVDHRRAASFATGYAVRGFVELDRMLRDARPEAVIIGTPHPLHAEAAVRAAEAGVHVLVEKPLAATLADCDCDARRREEGRRHARLSSVSGASTSRFSA